MTVSSTVSRNEYTGNGSTTVFAYGFKINADADIVVTIVDAAGTETVLTITTHYTVSGAGVAGGGNVTLEDLTSVVGSAALPSTYDMALTRKITIEQETDLSSQGGFSEETHESAFDKFIMIDQQQQEILDRCVKSYVTSTTTPDDLMDDIAAAVVVAQAAQTGAETAQTGAETAQTGAEAAETGAEAAQTGAETAETNSETSENNAAASEAAAQVAQIAAEAAVDGLISFEYATNLNLGALVKVINDSGAKVGAVAGPESIVNAPTKVTFSEDSTYLTSACFDSLNNVFFVAYRDAGNSNKATAVIGTVTDGVLTFGTPVIFNDGTTYTTSCCYDSNSNRVVVVYRDGSDSDKGTAIVGTISGTTVSFGTAVVFESGASNLAV